MSARPRVLAIGMDAADGGLVRRWAESGDLPVIASLMADGGMAPLDSLADHLPESTWASLLSGCGPGTHGVYNFREIRPGSYARARRPDGSYRQPFWHALGDQGDPVRLLLLDVPVGHTVADESSTIVTGWGQRGGTTEMSWPPGTLERVVERHGAYATNLNRETSGRPLLERSHLRTLERMIGRRADVLIDLMAERPWDLCIAPFFESHYAGHAFHQYAERERYPGQVPRGRGLEDALKRIYSRLDEAIGRLVAAAPPDTHVAVFSGLGLRPSTNGEWLLPRALAALGYTAATPPSPASRRRELARRAALTVVPRPVARALRRRLIAPEAVAQHDERIWLESTDWKKTRAWAETEPGSGWIRLNVAGREPDGIVEPGREYDELCAEITRELLELREVDTGLPAIEEVVHRDALTRGENSQRLPDLLVKWSRQTNVRRVRHPRVGVVEEGQAGWRATEHDANGFLVLSGPRVRGGARASTGRVEDVAPTLLHLLDGAVPEDLDGRVLTELLEYEAAGLRQTSVDMSKDGWAAARS